MIELEKAENAVRRAMAVVLVLSGLTSVLILALPFYMSQVFVRVLPSRSVETLLALSVMVAVAFIIYGICEFVKLAILVRAGARYEAQLAGPVAYAHFVDRSKDSASGSELMQDVQQVRGFIGSRACSGLTEAPFIPFFLLILFAVDTAIGLLTVGGMVVMVLLAILQERATRAGVERQNIATQASRRTLQSFLEQSEIVRVFGLQQIALAKWGVPKADALRSYIDTMTSSAFYGSMAKTVRLIIQAAILGLGAYLAILGEVSAIIVFACMIIGGRALAPMDALVGSWNALTNAVASHRRIRDSLDTFSVDFSRTQLPNPQGHYEIRHLVYGLTGQNEAIIKRISFDLTAGETLGIVGPSGAGKSTLLRLIAGALEPASGSIRLDGADLRQWDRIQLGQHIGYVPQSVEFFPGTVSENIARFDPKATDDMVVEAARMAGVHDMILRFPSGYDTLIGRGLFSPSGGQKQLLAVARAFYQDPKVLLFDEPNSNLDAQGDHILMQAIARAQRRGATIIVVTQRPVLLQAVHNVLILNNGMIEQFGSRADVLPKLVKPAEVAKDTGNQTIAGSTQDEPDAGDGKQARTESAGAGQ